MDRTKIEKLQEEAKNIIQAIGYDGNGMVDTTKCKEYIEKTYNIDITLKKISFLSLLSENGKDDSISKCGAMMGFYKKTGEGDNDQAIIFLNSDKSPVFQRFSFAHELGHIISFKTNIEEPIYNSEDKFTLSTHINYELTYINEKSLKDNPNLEKEQYANIFALNLLMPREVFIDKINSGCSFEKIALDFGINSTAVYSRAKLIIKED